MPKIEDIEYTPNPNARKIILKEPIAAPGVSKNFPNSTAANEDSLAKSLFDIPHVVSVFYMDRFVTINKDNDIEWEELLPQVAIPIRSASSIISEKNDPIVPKVKLGENPILDQINEVLDNHIRSALAGDGGGIEIIGLEGNVLSVRYQGACGSCPSSIAGTLYGIQNILRNEVDPTLEVIAV